MKKLISFILALTLASTAFAAGNDMIFMQRNAADTGTLTRLTTIPSGGQDGIFLFNGSTVLPTFITLGTNLSVTSGVLNAAGGGTQVNSDWTASTGVAAILNKPPISTVGMTGLYGDLISAPTVVSAFTNDASYVTSSSLTTTLGSYATTSALTTGLAGKFNTPTGTTAQYVRGDGTLATLPASGSGTVTSIIAGTGLSGGTITTTGTISLPNTGTSGTYSGVTTDAQGRVTAGTATSQASATRTLNSGFQVSTTRNALVTYSVRIVTTASIGGNQDGDVILEIASDSGFTTNVQTLSITQNAQSISLAVVLNSVQTQTGVLSGYVPAGYYARLRTVNNTGTPTYLYRAGQEVLL